jgi:large subunit ribosomal protein L29
MSKANDLREMAIDQLQAEEAAAKKDLFRLRFQASTEKLDTPSKLKELRRQIARIKTVLHERERQTAVNAEAK